MYEQDVRRMTAALGLKRRIVGVRFLYTWAEYEDSPLPEYGASTRFCYMVKQAGEGKRFKAQEKNFTCGRSREALGIDPPQATTASGELYYSCGIYESRAVAKQVEDAAVSIPQRIWGVEMGPLEEMETADVVIMIMDAFQTMRIVQGYAYHYGVMRNIGMVGNQGVCADLGARPFVMNDINLSVLCAGTRQNCQWGRDELGVGLPIQMFPLLANGVVQTLNGIEYPPAKEEILSRLSDPMELGVKIDPTIHYGKSASLWAKQRREDQARYEAHMAQEGNGHADAD